MKKTIDSIIRKLRRQRRGPDGRWETIVDAVRRDAITTERMDELLSMPISNAPEYTAEGCAVMT